MLVEKESRAVKAAKKIKKVISLMSYYIKLQLVRQSGIGFTDA